MKIAILLSNYFSEIKEVTGKDRLVNGGAERYLRVLNDLLIRKGYEPTIFCGYYPPNGGYPAEVVKHVDGMEIVNYAVTTGWSYNTLAALTKWFNERTRSYDLRVYFNTFLCWPHVIHPCISVCHGVYWDDPYGIYRYWKAEDRQEFWRHNLYGFTEPDLVVSVDHNSKNVISSLEPGEQRKIMVIPNFVDTRKFTPGKKTWDGIRVLFPRRMTHIRGWNLFKDATDLPYDFISCGQAINENEEIVMTNAVHKAVPNLLQTWVPGDDMAEVYQKVDIAVIPTVSSEGTSLSCLEAMSCGLGVISSDVGGLSNLIIDGHNGLLYDPDHDSLSEKIQLLAEDESLRKRLGKNARKTAMTFDVELWEQKWLRALEAAM